MITCDCSPPFGLVVLGAITKHGKAKREFEFIGQDKDRQLESLRRGAKIGDVLPGRILRKRLKGCWPWVKQTRTPHARTNKRHHKQECNYDNGEQEDDQAEAGERDPYNAVIFACGDLTLSLVTNGLS